MLKKEQKVSQNSIIFSCFRCFLNFTILRAVWETGWERGWFLVWLCCKPDSFPVAKTPKLQNMSTCKKSAYCSFGYLYFMFSFNCMLFCHPAGTYCDFFLLRTLFHFYFLPDKRFFCFILSFSYGFSWASCSPSIYFLLVYSNHYL